MKLRKMWAVTRFNPDNLKLYKDKNHAIIEQLEGGRDPYEVYIFTKEELKEVANKCFYDDYKKETQDDKKESGKKNTL